MQLFGPELNYKRIAQHVLFWLVVVGSLTVIYGVGKGYLMALRNTLFYLPVHLLYFYTVAYVVIPKFLYPKRYAEFALTLFLCIFFSALASRIVDILFINPYLYDIQQETGKMLLWEDPDEPFLRQLSRQTSFINAVKGSNLVIWLAIAVKFFKMWHERRQAALQAELNFLKGQIHPHFLFNTLNNLYALTLSQSQQAPPVVMGLSEILRYMLYECSSESIELQKEVQILQNYIALEKIRYEDRLDLNLSITGSLDGQKIAPLLLLPLVENAFKHGASEKVGQAWINMDFSIKGDLLKFKISNSKPESLPEDAATHFGNIGLNNVRKRLEILYPEHHRLKVFDEEDMFAVILELKLDKRVSI
ncbi:MAG TPA: histidine kinase [Sphingobacteriaceae bacterium]